MALISREELEEMYWGEPGTEMGVRLIAKRINSKPQNVHYYLKKYGIEMRPPNYKSSECYTKQSRKVIGKVAKDCNKNIPKTQKHRAKISKSHKGLLKGKKLSEEHKQKISNSLKGRKISAKTKRKISQSKGVKKEICLEIYNKYHKTRATMLELTNEYNIGYGTVNNIVNRKHWTTKHLKKVIA